MSTITPIVAESSLAIRLPAETRLKWLRDMLLIREFEVRCMKAYQDRKIGGFCHVYIGQEAVAVGCTAAVLHKDPIITAYRDHGHALARGMDARYAMAEMYGRIGGCAKGKGGSMHLFDRANNMFGGHGIVGAQCPLGTGLAFATKYEDEVINNGKSDRVTLCFLGDGALNQGAFHEAMNLAGILDLPIIFVCENNAYSMGTAITRGTTMGHNISIKAQAYGMEGIIIEGQDVLKVYDGMKPLIDRVRATCRPAFVDMRTYRYKGHSMSDPRKYRTRDEEQRYEADDPIDKLSNFMMNNDELSQEQYDEMVRDVRREVREAMKWADESPLPPIEELYTDVYVEEWGPYKGTSPPMMLTETSKRANAQKPKEDKGASDKSTNQRADKSTR
jgi:pyruvate dehydrogenase E1 component alpha subunit